LGYVPNKKNEIQFEASGTGGFEKLITLLKDDEIKYGVFETVVKGDKYNAVKYVLLTWIGEKVGPGLAKARCAAHRPELLKFINSCIAISAEFQPPTRAQLTSEEVAAKVLKVSGQDSASQTKSTMSRSHAKVGDTKTSKCSFNEASLKPALKSVHQGKNTWVVMGYVDRDSIDLVGQGTGNLDQVKEYWKDDTIHFVVYSITYTPHGATEKNTKYVLISLVGDNVKPLTKARSSGHRQDIADFVLSCLPFHTHFQPTVLDDLSEQNILSKLD